MGTAKWTSQVMNLRDIFPNLTDENHDITSPPTIKYNCIAWAAKNTDRWWEPGRHWPIESSRNEYGIGELVLAFQEIGYQECNDGLLESDFEKLALYAIGMIYTHAARQLPDGHWTSKLGQLEDITHATPEAIYCTDYGEVVQYMKRARS